MSAKINGAIMKILRPKHYKVTRAYRRRVVNAVVYMLEGEDYLGKRVKCEWLFDVWGKDITDALDAIGIFV
jgi:hypothetical protein